MSATQVQTKNLILAPQTREDVRAYVEQMAPHEKGNVKPFHTMKRFRNARPAKTALRFPAAGLLLLITLALQAAASDPLTGRVTSLAGSARYLTNESNWHALRLGDELAPGSTIQTSVKDSTVDITLDGVGEGGASTLRIFSNSVLRINRLSSKKSGAAEVKEIYLDLVVGQILGIVNRAFEYEIQRADKTLMRLATYRGTTNHQEGVYVFKASGALVVLSGALTVATVDPKGQVTTQLVSAGEKFSADTREITKLALDAPERNLWP